MLGIWLETHKIASFGKSTCCILHVNTFYILLTSTYTFSNSHFSPRFGILDNFPMNQLVIDF